MLLLITCGSFNNAISSSECICKICGKKVLWTTLMYSGILLEILEKTTGYLRQDSRFPGRDLIPDLLNAKQKNQLLDHDVSVSMNT